MIDLPELRAHRAKLEALEAFLATLPPLVTGLMNWFNPDDPGMTVMARHGLSVKDGSPLIEAWLDEVRKAGRPVGYLIWEPDVPSSPFMIATTPELPGIKFRLFR